MDNQNQPVERPQDFELVDLLFRDKIAAQRVLPGPSSTSTTPQISESFQARFQSFIDQIPSYMHSSNKPGFFTHFFLGSFSTLLDTQLNADKIHVKNLYYRFDGAKTLKVIAATEHKTHIFIFTEDSEEKHKSSTQTHNNKFEFTKDELDNINSARRKLKQSELNKKIEIKLVKIDDKSKIVSVVESKKIKDAGPAPTKFPFKEIGAQRNPGNYLEQDIEKLSGENEGEVNKSFRKILNHVKETHTALELSKDVYGSGAREADQHGFLAGVLDNFRYRYNTRIYLEQFAGRGYADIVLLVRGVARSTLSIPIIIELKAGTSAGTEPSNARQQAEGYALGFQPNTVRVLTFSNDVICVGLNLDYVPTDLVKETLKEINQIIDDENHIMGGALKEAIKDKLSEFTETNDPQLVEIIDDWPGDKVGLKEQITVYLQRPFSSRTVSWESKDTHPCIIGVLQSAKKFFNEKITDIELETEIENDLRRVYNTFPGTPEKGEKHYFSKFLLGQSILIKDTTYKKHVFIYEKDSFIPTEEPSETKTAGRQAKIAAAEKIKQDAKVSYDTSHAITTILFVPSGETETVCLVNIIESNRDLSFNKKIKLTDNLIGNRKIRTLNLLFRTDKSGESFDNFFKLGPIDPREPYSNLQEYNNLNGNLEEFNGKFENILYPAGLKERFDETLNAQKKTSTQAALLENYKKLFEQTLVKTINPFKSLIGKEAHFQGVLQGVWSHYSDLKLSEEPATRAVVLTEFQTGRGNRIDMLIHGIGPLLDPKEYQPIGLEIKGPRKGVTDRKLMQEAEGQLNDYKTVVYKTLTDGDTVYLVPVVFSPADKSSLIQLGTELFPVPVVHSSIQLLPKPTAARAEDLERVVAQSKKIGLKPLPGPSCTPRRRRRRDLSSCIEAESRTEEQFHYQPLPEKAPTEQIWASREYFQSALALHYQQVRHTQEKVETWLHYQQAIGAILSEGEANHSPREVDTLNHHYEQAQQFVNHFPKQKLFDSISGESISPISEKRQCWWLENGRYSLSLLWDGRLYALYSPDLNYQHLLYAKPDATLSEITEFASAFFQWRSEGRKYTTWTLKEGIPFDAWQEIAQSNFFQPHKVVPDQMLLAQSGAQIEGVPIQGLQALIRLDGKPVAPEALHADFLRLNKAHIQLHVESLHQVLPLLSADEQRNLARVVRQYGWPDDSSSLHDLPEAQKRPLLEYHRLIMEAFKGNEAIPITLGRLSEFSWDALQHELADYLRELPPEMQTPVTKEIVNAVKSNMEKAWSMGKQLNSQALFFLPDMIRFANSGDPLPLIKISGMIIGDHVTVSGLNYLRTTIINRVHKNFLLILQKLPPIPGVTAGMLTGHAKNLAKMLHRIPILSPIFTGLTLYSIVELSQQLPTLSAGSAERQAVISELALQTTALALIIGGPLFGAATGPLWVTFTAISLFVAAENLRQTAKLNVPFGKALGFSLGFYQDELRVIYQERELVTINLALAENLSTFMNATHPTLGWVVVKVPPLSNSEWRNVTHNKIPFVVEREIGKQLDIPQLNVVTGKHYYKVHEETTEVHGFKRIKKFEAIQPECSAALEGYGGCPPSRGLLLADYWQQRVYHAAPIFSTVQITAASGIWKRGNNFIPSFPPPWGNYTLESSVEKDMGLTNAINHNKHRESKIEKLEVTLKVQSIQYSQSMSAPSYPIFKREIPLLTSIDAPAEINRTVINPPEYCALYADKRTFLNPTAQRALYFFFDPREGNSVLEISTDGIQVWDQLNQQHNANYFNAQDSREYLITVQVGYKEYPDSIIFPPCPASILVVSDRLHRISSRYFIQDSPTVPFKIIDDAASVDIIFSGNQKAPETLKSLFTLPEDFQIEVVVSGQKSNFITLLGNKTRLGLTLSEHFTIDYLKLAAQQVEIFHAQGVNSHGLLELDCLVETFTVDIRGDLTVSHCGDDFSLTKSRVNPGIRYSKLVNLTDFTLYQLQLPEPKALPSLLESFKQYPNGSKIVTTFSVQEAHGTWKVPRYYSGVKQLDILGQLNDQNATLLLQAEQFTLTQFTETFQPTFVLVKHYTTQANFTQSLRLLRAKRDIHLAKHFPTNEESVQVQRVLEILATQSAEGQDAILIFQSPQGYLEIHCFASENFTLNGIDYQVKTEGKLYAIGATNRVIRGDQLLRYNGSDSHPVGIYFPTSISESQLSLDNGILSVNRIQLDQIPQQTRLYFGPMGPQQQILSVKALQDTLSQAAPERIRRQRRQLLGIESIPFAAQRTHRNPRQIPDMPSSASRPTPWITTLWKGLLEMLPSYSTPLLDLGIREKPTDPPVTKEIFSGHLKPLDLEKLNSFMMILSLFLELRRVHKQQKPASKFLPSEQAITHKQRIEWLKQLDKLEKKVEDLFKRVARDGKIVNKRHEWPQWWLEDLQEQYGKFTQVDQTSQEEITVFEEKLQATLNELDEILRPSAVPPGGKRHAGQSFHKTDTTEPEPKPKPAEDLDDIIQDINILFSENSDIISAIKKNDLTRVRSYIEENKNVNARSKGGRPLIMVAVENNCSIGLVELLIDNGSDVNLADPDGESAINLAAYKGSFELIKLLISRGAKIKGKTEKNSPFSSIAESCLPKITQDQVIKLLTEWQYKTSNATNLTRILVQQVPAMHSSIVYNTLTSRSVSNPDPVYSNRVIWCIDIVNFK